MLFEGRVLYIKEASSKPQQHIYYQRCSAAKLKKGKINISQLIRKDGKKIEKRD